MKNINRRLERLEQAVKDRPINVDVALDRLQKAVEGLEGEERILTAMGEAKQASPEHSIQVFSAWLATLSSDELRFTREFIHGLADEIRASLEAEDLDAE